MLANSANRHRGSHGKTESPVCHACGNPRGTLVPLTPGGFTRFDFARPDGALTKEKRGNVMGQIIYYGVVIRSPEDTESRKWELSAPGRDVIALDTDELVKRIFTP